MSQRQTTFTDYQGKDVTVRHLENISNGHRLKVAHPDGRQWIVTVELDGDVNVEVTRRDGTPTDLATPDWLEENLSRFAVPA